jgi:predicted O-methyltransferase YrrM
MTAVVPVGIVVAAVLATGLFVRDRLAAITQSEQRLHATIRQIEARIKQIEPQILEISAIAAFSSVDVPYPLPLGGHWALAWDAAAILAREVGAGRPMTVVELGSGGSSLVIGMQLRHGGRGHLYSLDHNPDFAASTRRHVTALGLDSWVFVLDAPLVGQRVGDEEYTWYDLPDEVRALERIDILVVDGPPQATDREGTPRYPALPILGDKLGPGSLVFVDDAFRDAERRMLERWLRDQPHWVSQTIRTLRGTAILRWPHGAGGEALVPQQVPGDQS